MLRDVLGFHTDEAASILEATPQSVKAALQRARATLDSSLLEREQAPLPDSPTERNLLATFSDAVEAGDTARIVNSAELRRSCGSSNAQTIGYEAIGGFLDDRAEFAGRTATRDPRQRPAGLRLLPALEPRGMMVLTLGGNKVDEITFFADPALPRRFGLPEHI